LSQWTPDPIELVLESIIINLVVAGITGGNVVQYVEWDSYVDSHGVSWGPAK
jgi:hypothetical protein